MSPSSFSILPPTMAHDALIVGAVLAGGSLLLSAVSGRRGGGGRPSRATPTPDWPDHAMADDPGSQAGPTPGRRTRGSASSGPARRPPRVGVPMGGRLPLMLADAIALACLHFDLGAQGLRLTLLLCLVAESATLAAFAPWAARHRAWLFADYGHFLALLPGIIAARARSTAPTRHRTAFATAAARRRSALERRARAAQAAWRADEALRRHSPGYAASGARIEAARAADGVTDLRLRFPGGVPDAAVEAAFREHAESGLLARAAGVSAACASLVETADGLLVLRLRPGSAEDEGDGAGPVRDDGDGGPAGEGAVGDDASPLGPGLPPLTLLAAAPPRSDHENGAATAQRVLAALQAQGTADARLVATRTGPTVTVVVVRPPNGPAAARILRLTDDLRFRLGEGGLMVRRAAGFPGCAAIEVPNARRSTVSLRAVLAQTRAAEGDLMAPVGVATDGSPLVTDLAAWPHGLVAGATGAGKSVYVHATLVALLLRYSPAELRLVLIDPKRVEFSDYRPLPHLLRLIVVDPAEAVEALEDAVAEMRRRYAALERAGARKLSDYNARVPEAQCLPRLLVVIDEAQAIMQDKENAEQVIAASKDLAAMGRAAGVHLLYGTQHPLVTVIPSALKANTPTRVALQVRTRVNSMVVLDQPGAEALLGAGDMLVCTGGGAEVQRAQSAFISDDGVRAVVRWWAEHGRATGDGVEGGEDGAGDDGAQAVRADALRLLRALVDEAIAQADALASAHIAFVRRGEIVAVRRDHVERVLRRMDAEPGAAIDHWRAEGWIRGDGENATVVMRTPWQSRARMVVVEWTAIGGTGLV